MTIHESKAHHNFTQDLQSSILAYPNPTHLMHHIKYTTNLSWIVNHENNMVKTRP